MGNSLAAKKRVSSVLAERHELEVTLRIREVSRLWQYILELTVKENQVQNVVLELRLAGLLPS